MDRSYSEALSGNSTSYVNLEDLKMDSNFAMLLCSLVFAISWVIYITYYNSRVVGYIITKIANRLLIKEGYFQVGSFALNALSGKIMFRDIVYITHDYTMRIQDGYVIFRWWRSYVPKDVSEDLSHSDTRLSVVLNGFELHVYNRSHLYSQLEKIFGLDPNIFPESSTDSDEAMNVENLERNQQETTEKEITPSTKKQRPEAAMARTWRDLIPVIKMDISTCRIVFGNRSVPTTLSITVEESHFVYSTKPAVSALDMFMHFVKCKAENMRVMLAPSPKYTGMLDEPPRYMGEGFVLMSSNDMELYFYMDEAGIVPQEPILITLANGDRVESNPPQWGMDIKCGKCTDFSYGPWADRQREHLFKFFYPSEYTPMPITAQPQPGDKRQMQTFDIRLSMQNEATIDILFSKDKETNAVHVNVGPGSYLEITIPWMITNDGYMTKINGQLLHLDATTSLQYRDFVVSETLEFCLLCKYPRVWNDEQVWELNMTGCKATVHILFCHKWFFTDFINDWSSKQPADILHFIPYTWRFGLTLKHCEILTFVNQHNWMDCSSVGQKQRLENTQIALCAHFLHLSFELPFDEFLPETVPLNFSIQGESIDLSLFIPEFHTSRNIVLALEKFAKVRSKDGSTTKKTEIIPKWRNICQKSCGWVDFWWVPIGAITIVYTYHPCPPLGPSPQADISTPVKEDILLSPIRIPHMRKQKKCSPEGTQKFDPTVLKADIVTVELEIGPSILLLYGTALRNFINFKENIFGEDQMFTDLQQTSGTTGNVADATGGDNGEGSIANVPVELREDFDHRYYRPLDVDVSIVIHDVQGHLLKNCTEKDPACPVILVERFGFEMKKRYDQTELQLLLSPAVLLVSDNLSRSGRDKHLEQGRLTLSSLQIRGHAMFSDNARTLTQDTVEYAWLVELQLGKLSGKLSAPQLHTLLACMETLLLLACDTENELNSPAQQVALRRGEVASGGTVKEATGFHQMQQAIQQFLQPKSGGVVTAQVGGRVGVAGSGGVGGGGTGSTNSSGSNTNVGQKSALLERKNKTGGGSSTSGGHTGGATSATGGTDKPTGTLEELNESSHNLKYKFTRLAVDAIDLWLVESGAALQLWISPIRLSTCNLHGKQVGSGLSCLIFGMSLRQLVWQPHKYNHSKITSETCDFWLEVGKIDFAPLLIESAMSSDRKEPHAYARQQRFLKAHDDRHKKLWFLWAATDSNNTGVTVAGHKCGCSGGCVFFGSNKNGARFFRPSIRDLDEGTNIAAFRVNERGSEPGYGQSILHDDMLVFRTPPYLPGDVTLQDSVMQLRGQYPPVQLPTPAATTLSGSQLVHSLDRHSEGRKSTTAVLTSLEGGGVMGAGGPVVNRRYSSTSIRSVSQKNVPYARLLDNKLDTSDSKLHHFVAGGGAVVTAMTTSADQSKLLHVTSGQSPPSVAISADHLPKSSASDSKLAVGYFQTGGSGVRGSGEDDDVETDNFNDSGPSSDPIRHIDSRTSLNRRASIEKIEKEVQRTISMSSENHSEAFFSADEEMHINSRSSSLRNSILSSNGTLTRQGSNTSSTHASKKFSSDLSIAQNKTIISSSAPNSSEETKRGCLATYRSDHEIHTPEHRSFTDTKTDSGTRGTVHGLVTPQRHPHTASKSNTSSPRLGPSTTLASSSSSTTGGATTNTKSAGGGVTRQLSEDSASSSTDTYSNNSYASAIGSQEDFTLVDLHMQVNRQIVDSPMLLSSYITHLNQVRCTNWPQTTTTPNSNPSSAYSVPLYQKSSDGRLVYSGGRFVPHMESVHEGVTTLKMTAKQCTGEPNTTAGGVTTSLIGGAHSGTTPYLYPWETTGQGQEEGGVTEEDDVTDAEEELLSGGDGSCARTSVIVKLKGDLDVMISPLLLETLQRYIDALTPTVSNLHPLTVVNHLHACCIDQVESANVLKTPENIAKLGVQPTPVGPPAKQTGGAAITTSGGDGVHEETIKKQLQAAIILPKVNVTLLQVSIVEEIISFSALDNIKDLTCVSMFSVCFDNIVTKFHSDIQTREVLQKLYRPAVVTADSKDKSGANRAKQLLRLQHTSGANAADRILQGEPVYVESCGGSQKQLVVSVQVGKVHAQLRRLRNESSLLDDAIITAIPSYSSKVLFKCSKVPPRCRTTEYFMQKTLEDGASCPNSVTKEAEETNGTGGEDKLGFIMFEGGLEGISVKFVKKSQQTETDSQPDEPEADLTQNHPTDEPSITRPSTKEEEATTTADTSNKLFLAVTPKLGESSAKSTTTTRVTSTTDDNPVTGAAASGDRRSVKSDRKEGAAATTAAASDAGVGGAGDCKEVVGKSKDNGNISSCVIEFKVVWFNFAAPPKAPITRKIDYTRLDWNLLSTASPAINAWMNPSNRLAIRVVHMFRCMYRRSTATVACLMAEALEEQTVHLATKSRYGKLKPLSKTLHEDPSCQLCTVLQKYYLQTEPSVIEVHLRENELPQLFTLRQGVIVLSRQWKNILYTPLLPQTNSKSKLKPMNVTISVPEVEEDVVLTDGENSLVEENDITDEHARLLHSGIILKPHKHSGIPLKHPNSNSDMHSPPLRHQHQQLIDGYLLDGDGVMAAPGQQMPFNYGDDDSEFTSPSPPGTRTKRKKSLHLAPSSSRNSIVLPLVGTNQTLFMQRKTMIDDEHPGYGTTLPGVARGVNLGSDLSVCSHSSPELPGSPSHLQQEDLYNWMARQGNAGNLEGCLESKIDTLQTDSTMEGGVPSKENVATQGISLYHIHDSLRLMDANLIFRPLLSSLGVMPQQLRLTSIADANTSSTDVTTLDALGSNLSLVGNMETMRIDIVVSEHGKTEPKRGKGKGKARLHLEINTDDCPAFVCEKVSVELEIDRLTDMASNDAKNVLYLSRGQLKNHTSTSVNFNIGVRYISQRVNMPLLRLLHQISNMYQNVKDTQNELREQQPVDLRRPKTSASDHGDINKHRSASACDLQLSSTTHPHPDKPPSLKISDHGGSLTSTSHVILTSSTKPSHPVISPSPSLRSRPHSFAQKLRSTGKTVRGYVNLSEGSGTGTGAGGGVHTPVGTLSSPSGSALERVTVSSDKSAVGARCWKTIYHLLDLYGNVPDTRTIKHRFSVGPHDISEHYKGSRKYDILTEVKTGEDGEKRGNATPLYQRGENSTAPNEHNKLIVFGVARIHRTRLLATLSVLKLEAEITNLHSSLTCKKKSNPASLECSLTGQVGRTMIMLLEGVAPNQQTVVKVTVGKSQALYSSVSKRTKDNNSGLLTVGAVNIDIPQHPVALHGMVTRGSKQLSSTLQELRVNRTSSRMSKSAQHDEEQTHHPQSSPNKHVRNVSHASASFLRGGPNGTGNATGLTEEDKSLLQPLVMQFSIILQSLSITAALLPSLQAQYKMDQVNSSGVTGSKAKFTIDLPHHSLSFTTKLQVTEANLPSEASIALPAVHVSAEYIPEGATAPLPPSTDTHTHQHHHHHRPPQEGVVFMQGGYLSAHADIGDFEHSLTTDLLNHLVFVQKVFMKEVNEVVQKVYGGERPVAIWLEDADEQSAPSLSNRVLFSLVIQMQRIQLTATTASSSAVRLETGAVVLELSNRVKNVSGSTSARLFGKAQVDLNLSLGQLIRNALFEEADAEFQQFAFFNTRIGLRNAFQDEMVEGEDKEVVLITLKRPLVYIQPVAVDKAILVWLNYKNAYDYWNEKRANLNKEVISATQQVYEKFQIGQITSQLSTPHLGTLFLQLTVEDMGICLPLNPLPLTNWRQRNVYEECRGAVVITLENTSISACSSGSLVSKGKFSNLCLRFADDFETSLDDWKPDMSDSTIMNLCVVSDGTYEVCSRTIAAKMPNENAKWFLNVQWQMEGVDIHLDVNVGKQLSALGHTLTMLTGAEDTTTPHYHEEGEDDSGDEDDVKSPGGVVGASGGEGVVHHRSGGGAACHHHHQQPVPSFLLETDNKKRSRLIEQEMNEQAKIINDLRSLGASHGTIELELKRLHELETLVYQDFRRDMIQKLRRQSIKGGASSKGKPPAGGGRTKSFNVPSPMMENSLEDGSEDDHLVTHHHHHHHPSSILTPASSFDIDSNSPQSSAPALSHLPTRTTSLRSPTSSNTTTTHRGVTFSDAPDQQLSHSQQSQQQSSQQSQQSSLSREHHLARNTGGGSGSSNWRRQPPSLASGDSDLSLTTTAGTVLSTLDDDSWQREEEEEDEDGEEEGEEEEDGDEDEEGDHIDIDGMRVELRRKNMMGGGGGGGYDSYDSGSMKGGTLTRDQLLNASLYQQGGNTSMTSQKPQEPNIDLELDVKVFINSGKCVLHTKDTARDEEIKLRMRKDRSCSAGLLEFPPPTASPDPSRRNKEKLTTQSSSSRLRNVPHATLVDLTIFHIPGMDVKLHYQSKVLTDDLLVESGQHTPANFADVSGNQFGQMFREQSFDSFAIRKLSPDNTSDVNRIDQAFKRQESNTSSAGLDSSKTGTATADFSTNFSGSGTASGGISNPNYSPGTSNGSHDSNVPFQKSANNSHRKSGIKKASLFAWMTLQSVPEETIISPHILEFLEQTLEPIPTAKTATSLLSSEGDTLATYGNYVYASFPVDVIVYFHMQPSTFRFSCLPVSRVECMLQLPSLDIVFSSKRAEDELLQSEFGGDGATTNAPTSSAASTAVGGLSVTGCLSDFSVYIFHPYGGKKSALKEAQWSPLADSERKDSLSVNVEFVKFHLSRSRMMNFKQETKGVKGTAGDHSSRNVIRFSTITDIGSASFKYDMRRLTEILAFPKAWYRRSIVRRMFLGDLSISASCYDEEEPILHSNNTTSSSTRSKSSSTGEKSPLLPGKDKLKLALDPSGERVKLLGRSYSGDSGTVTESPSPEHKSVTAWETLVLFAVNFKKLNVHMNMGNVMGNVSWLTKDFSSEGRLSIGSTGHKNLYIALGLCGSGLDAKGGIVGGNIELASIDTYIHIREEPNVEPDHRVGLKLKALELRLDYMATSVLMCRASDLSVNLRDEWKLNTRASASASMIPTRRPASIFMHVDMTWDQLQIMMSKSSTADLLKMFNKLEEFFSQQFNSSKRAFSGFSGQSRPSKVTPQRSRDSSVSSTSSTQPPPPLPPPPTSDTDPSSNPDHPLHQHRHWQRVLAVVAHLQLHTMHVPLPAFGTVLGGRVELHGTNISLACFHGINFKSKSWALFSLKEPCITFNTEAQEIPTNGESSTLQDVHIVQTMTCSLGSSTYKTHQSMATVCKVSRTVIFPPQFKTLQEWFHYAFANSQIDDVDRFPSLEREKETNSIERTSTRGSGSSSGSSQKLSDPNHTREVIFALPSLELHLKTEHLQIATTPLTLTLEPSMSPVVECSFITEFEDHIFVTVDAESFFFLHDLITSYVKEKDRVLASSQFDRNKHSSLHHTHSTSSHPSSSPNLSSLHPASANSSSSTHHTPTSHSNPRTPFTTPSISNNSNTPNASGSNKTSSTRASLDSLIRDGRQYNCKTWHLEPTVRLLSVAGKYIEPYGIDYILQKLGFAHARTTIPKWMQRGFMDPLDAILSVLTLRMVQVIKGEGGEEVTVQISRR